MKKLLIATKNEGKMKEFKAKLEPLGFKLYSLNDIGFNSEIEETGETFLENALIKAKTIAKEYNLVTLADDSGLIVDALPGELGVKSKRFSKTGKDSDNNILLLEKLKTKTNRKARFVSQLVLYYPNDSYYSYLGKVEGVIAKEPLGTNGFGYDPIFQVLELDTRMALLTKEEKNKISHRGRALEKLVEDIINENITI